MPLNPDPVVGSVLVSRSVIACEVIYIYCTASNHRQLANNTADAISPTVVGVPPLTSNNNQIMLAVYQCHACRCHAIDRNGRDIRASNKQIRRYRGIGTDPVGWSDCHLVFEIKLIVTLVQRDSRKRRGRFTPSDFTPLTACSVVALVCRE